MNFSGENMLRTMILAVALLLASAVCLHAAEKEVPVNITADRMEYSDTGKNVVFTGNVKVVRDSMVVDSERLVAYLGQGGPGGGVKGGTGASGGQVEKIVATGNVRVKMDQRKGKCATLTYDVKNGVLTMEGNPVLSEGRNTIQGEVVKFYLKDSRSEIIGGKKRVEAIFFTPKEMEPEEQ